MADRRESIVSMQVSILFVAMFFWGGNDSWLPRIFWCSPVQAGTSREYEVEDEQEFLKKQQQQLASNVKEADPVARRRCARCRPGRGSLSQRLLGHCCRRRACHCRPRAGPVCSVPHLCSPCAGYRLPPPRPSLRRPRQPKPRPCPPTAPPPRPAAPPPRCSAVQWHAVCGVRW